MEEKKRTQVIENSNSSMSDEKTSDESFKELLTIPGLTVGKARLLYRAGYTTLSKLENAKIEDLLKIDGINGKTVGMILKERESNIQNDGDNELKEVAKMPDLSFRNDLSHYSAGYKDISKLKKAKIDDLMKIEGIESKPVSKILKDWGLKTVDFTTEKSLIPPIRIKRIEASDLVIKPLEERVEEIPTEDDLVSSLFDYVKEVNPKERADIEPLLEASVERIAEGIGRTMESTVAEYVERLNNPESAGTFFSLTADESWKEIDPIYKSFIERMAREINKTMDTVVAEHVKKIMQTDEND